MIIAYRHRMLWKDATAQGECILQDLSLITKTWITEWEWAQKPWEVKHYSWAINNQKIIQWSMNQYKISLQVHLWICSKFQIGAQKWTIKWITFWSIKRATYKVLTNKMNKVMIHQVKNTQEVALEATTKWIINMEILQVSMVTKI